MAKLTYIHAATEFAEKPKIDAQSGIVFGMSVITEGEAKGHGLMVDTVSLNTCLAASRSHTSGVLCKADHGSGVFEALGVLKNFRVDGIKLRADLHLLNSHPRRDSILEMAHRMPNALGLSITFKYAPEIINEQVFIRVQSLFSVDLVDSPACNTGMFSEPAKPSLTRLARVEAAFKREAEARRSSVLSGIERTRAILERSSKPLSGLEKTKAAFKAQTEKKKI